VRIALLSFKGIGFFTVVDGRLVTGADIGNNFFLTLEALGQPRAAKVTEYLQELNEDVKGSFLVEVFSTTVIVSFFVLANVSLSKEHQPIILVRASILGSDKSHRDISRLFFAILARDCHRTSRKTAS